MSTALAPTATSTAAVALRHVTKTHANGVRALDDVTLDVPHGCARC